MMTQVDLPCPLCGAPLRGPLNEKNPDERFLKKKKYFRWLDEVQVIERIPGTVPHIGKYNGMRGVTLERRGRTIKLSDDAIAVHLNCWKTVRLHVYNWGGNGFDWLKHLLLNNDLSRYREPFCLYVSEEQFDWTRFVSYTTEKEERDAYDPRLRRKSLVRIIKFLIEKRREIALNKHDFLIKQLKSSVFIGKYAGYSHGEHNFELTAVRLPYGGNFNIDIVGDFTSGVSKIEAELVQRLQTSDLKIQLIEKR